MSATCRSAYVHIPFCRRRCGYCDFYSQVLADDAVEPLIDALLRELDTWTTRTTLRLETIYVGGGTPTVLPVPQLRRLLSSLAAHNIDRDTVEFTVEANPATVTTETAAMLAETGVNRISIGAQSFVPSELTTLDRSHHPDQVTETIAACRDAGINNISLDLIFGIPGQTLTSLQQSLEAAMSLQPDHISCYGLTFEPGTPLHARLEREQVQRVPNDLEADMYECVIDTLEAGGYPQYEISNFARPRRACRHNVLCWQNESYVGIGPSAAGYVDGVRYRNIPDTPAYIDAIASGNDPWCESERLAPQQRAGETAMLALRTRAGINRQRFTREFGQDPVEHFATAVREHEAAGHLEVTADAVRLTRAGLLIADRVMADFL